MRWFFLLLFFSFSTSLADDIIAVRAERGDPLPEARSPHPLTTGSDLILIREDGGTEVLVDPGPGRMVDSPNMSIDGRRVYYSVGRWGEGADLFVMELSTREIKQLTHGGTCAPTYNLHPQEVPGGWVIYVSNSPDCTQPIGRTDINLRLTALSLETGESETVGYLSAGGALHPILLHDGRVMFSSLESQGRRDKRPWGLWSIYPDGRKWAPLMSALSGPSVFHFHAQGPDRRIYVAEYYPQNNGGMGTGVSMNIDDPLAGRSFFGSPVPSENPVVPRVTCSGNPPTTFLSNVRYSFSPMGMTAFTQFAVTRDVESCPDPDGSGLLGKVSHPRWGPDALYLIWTESNRPERFGGAGTHTGIYRIPMVNGALPVVTHPSEMGLVRHEAAANLLYPTPVVSWAEIHGGEPNQLAWLPTDPRLKPGEPFGLVGTSSVCKHDADAYQASVNWTNQGASIQPLGGSAYGCESEPHQIHSIRILAMEPSRRPAFELGDLTTNVGQGERLRVLCEIPLRKPGIIDSEGRPDTSFLAKIPADTLFTFQTIDSRGRVLNHSGTWHQLRPGEVRNDCGGCHAHAQIGMAFEGTAASRPEYEIIDCSRVTPLVADLGMVEDQRPVVDVTWADIADRLGMAYAEAAVGVRPYDPVNSAVMTGLSGQIAIDVARWISLGAPSEERDRAVQGAWLEDEQRPTLVLVNGIVGAYDARGLTGPPVVLVNGVKAALTQLDASRWAYSGTGRVEASATDVNGNTSRLVRVFEGLSEPAGRRVITIDCPADDCVVTEN